MENPEDVIEDISPVFVVFSGRVEKTATGDVARSYDLVNLNQITHIEVTPPYPNKMDFPEAKTKKLRPKMTEYKCELHYPNGSIRRIVGKEAEAFGAWLQEFGFRRFDNLEVPPPEAVE